MTTDLDVVTVKHIKEMALKRYAELRAELDELEKIINAISPLVKTQIPRAESFKDWTIPQCAKQLLLEAGTSLTSKQMLKEMVARGWATSSKRPITVLHSGLSETPYVSRVGKRWELSPKGKETQF